MTDKVFGRVPWWKNAERPRRRSTPPPAARDPLEAALEQYLPPGYVVSATQEPYTRLYRVTVTHASGEHAYKMVSAGLLEDPRLIGADLMKMLVDTISAGEAIKNATVLAALVNQGMASPQGAMQMATGPADYGSGTFTETSPEAVANPWGLNPGGSWAPAYAVYGYAGPPVLPAVAPVAPPQRVLWEAHYEQEETREERLVRVVKEKYGNG